MIRAPIFLPVVVLAAWTMVMLVWMMKARIPAIIRARMRLDPKAVRGEQMNSLPAEARWKADNYNHLMEQPTVFYATALVLGMVGEGEGVGAILAWIYVVSRIIHSFVQALGMPINLRFGVFAVSSFALVALVAKAVLVLV